ncbi:hypothetical protein ACFL0M_12980 [Thermodesulfobacteriota bacterium]
MTMEKKYYFMIFMLIFTSIISCATIPEEAVTLNEEIGKNIADSHTAYMNLLEYFFAQRRAAIDAKMELYTKRLMENIKQRLPSGQRDIPLIQMERLVKEVTKRRNMLHEELEKTRVLLVDRLNKDHLLVVQANANITTLLQSFVELDKGTRSLTAKALQFAGTDLNLPEINEILDAQLLQAGDTAADVAGAFGKILKLFQGGGKK